MKKVKPAPKIKNVLNIMVLIDQRSKDNQQTFAKIVNISFKMVHIDN